MLNPSLTSKRDSIEKATEVLTIRANREGLTPGPVERVVNEDGTYTYTMLIPNEG